MTSTHSSSLLITGVSGHLGRQVVEHLLAQGHGPLIATTRTPERHADLAARGVELRYADFDDPASLPQAFAGARRALIISTGTMDASGRRVRQHGHAIDAARQAGVAHLLYTSFLGADDPRLALLCADHLATEQLLRDSGLGFTVLRHAFYAEMLLETLPRAITSGQLLTAAGDGTVPYISRADCARSAAAALVDPFQGRRVLNITGPAAVSAADVAGIASAVLGRAIQAVKLDGDELRSRLQQAGVPAQLALILAAIDRRVSEGALVVRSDDFERLTGIKPESVADFIGAYRSVLLGS